MRTICRAILLLIAGTLLFTSTVSCDNPLSLFQNTTTTQAVITTLGDNGEVPTEGKTVDWEATQASIDASKEAQAEVELDAQKKILSRIKNRKPHDELITKTVDIYAFMKKHSANPLIQDKYPSIRVIDEDIGIECIRQSKADKYYSVHKLEQGGLMYIFYLVMGENNSYLRMYNWLVVQKSLSYSDFASIDTGSAYEDVEKIDDVAKIYKQRFDDAAQPKPDVFYSQHYLTDGIIVIDYSYKDGKCVVCRVHREGFWVFHSNAGSNPEYDGQVLEIDVIQ